jgi:purine-binding chemotaxis protein CheW
MLKRLSGGEMVEQEERRMQLVTFQLGEEHYGINIMSVDGIVRVEETRPIPNAPSYVEGIFNLRGEIIPIINLHKRFHLKRAELSEEDELLSGFIIIDIKGMKLGIIIDKVSRVVTVDLNKMQPPPQMLSGIGAEYIQGVFNRDDGYLIMLDILRLFDPKELQQLEYINE